VPGAGSSVRVPADCCATSVCKPAGSSVPETCWRDATVVRTTAAVALVGPDTVADPPLTPGAERRVSLRVLIADDDALARAALRTIFDAHDDLELVAEAQDGL
jgi:hypothetical protein